MRPRRPRLFGVSYIHRRWHDPVSNFPAAVTKIAHSVANGSWWLAIDAPLRQLFAKVNFTLASPPLGNTHRDISKRDLSKIHKRDFVTNLLD